MLDTVLHGDALAMLKTLPDNSVDSIVTDPPAGISFMGKDWDTFTPDYLEQQAEREKKRKSLGPQEHNGKAKKRSSSAFGSPAHYAGSYDFTLKGRAGFITFMTEIMAEALRVLKPGGHALVWALPRTSHWTATALEDAGLEIREKCYHIFGSGFPKSLDVSKAIDKHLGKEREKVTRVRTDGKLPGHEGATFNACDVSQAYSTDAITPEAQQWQGYGSALKPSVEEWILCRKPLAESSIAANVLAWNCGALNIDACRVAATDNYGPVETHGASKYMDDRPWSANGKYKERPAFTSGSTQGRWPSHLLLSHSLWCIPQGVKRVRGDHKRGQLATASGANPGMFGLGVQGQSHDRYADADGYEQVEAYQCHESCPIAELDRQSGVRNSHGTAAKATFKGMFGNGKPVTGPIREADQGGASRYFTNFPPDDYTPYIYQSKASRAERNAGCEGLPSNGRGIAMRGHDPDPYLVRVHEPNAQVIAAYLKHWREKANLSKTEMDEKLGTVTLYSWFEGRPAGTQLPTPDMWLKLKDILGFDDTHDTEMTEVQLQEKRGFENSLPTSNSHPTVKSLALMRWLIRLITPPGGTVLDCFAGSGSTLVAAIQEGMHFIGIEQDESYTRIANARIAHAIGQVPRGRAYMVDPASTLGASEQSIAQEYDCAEDCPIRIIGEQSGERKSAYPGNPAKAAMQSNKRYDRIQTNAYGERYSQAGPMTSDTGTAARYFQQFPPDSLFAECDEEVAI